MGIARNLLRFFLKRTAYELSARQQKLPVATLDNVKLAMALLLRTQPQPVFVQVGAYDGQTDDPTSEFVRLGKMKCVLIEPIARSFNKLKTVYGQVPNVHLIQAAVGLTDGEIAMYQVKAGSPSDTLCSGGFTSFDRAHLIKHKVQPQDIESVTVPCLTLKSLLARFDLHRMDVLQVDTEGFDAEVVKMALNLDTPPGCINFENIHLNLETKAALYDQLTRKGYVYSHDKFNTLALHQSLLEKLTAV
jgi:FkbM family methyltransferase